MTYADLKKYEKGLPTNALKVLLISMIWQLISILVTWAEVKY